MHAAHCSLASQLMGYCSMLCCVIASFFEWAWARGYAVLLSRCSIFKHYLHVLQSKKEYGYVC